MVTTLTGWTTLSEDPLVLSREYSFGPGVATALVVGLPGRKLLVVSPPRGLSSAEWQALEAHGEVVALLANNGAHHLGLPEALAAFPLATAYAADAARQRIQKRTRLPRPIVGIDQLGVQLGDKVDVVAADGCKIGDVLVRVRTEHGPLLYVSDFVANIPKLPPNPIIRLLFRLSNSGPGLRVFRIFFTFYTHDKRAARDFLVRELEAQPPAILVPAHGEVIRRPDVGSSVVSLLRAAY